MSISAMPAIGTSTSQPASTVMRPRNMTRKTTSTVSTTVVDAKKSRTISYSETRRANAPVLPWRSAIGRFITFSNSFCDSLASSLRPTSSINLARATRSVKSNAEREQHAQRQHPQRRHRLVRDDPVVDVHREQRHREGEQVDDQRGEQHRPELAADLPHFRPEPMACAWPCPTGARFRARGWDRFRRRPLGRYRPARAPRA